MASFANEQGIKKPLILLASDDTTSEGQGRTFEGAAKDPFGNLRAGFEGSVAINRKDWGVSWNAALEGGGVLVSDKVTLEFEVSAVKSA